MTNKPSATATSPDLKTSTEAEIEIKPWPDSATKEEVRESWRHGGDDFLRTLIDLVNGRDVDLAMTLLVHGTIVSGHLASGHLFFEGFTEGLPDEMRRPLAQPGEVYLERRRALDEDDATIAVAPQYIHLRDAHVFTPGQPALPGNRGVWWRGRVESVDAWFLGSLGAESPTGQ